MFYQTIKRGGGVGTGMGWIFWGGKGDGLVVLGLLGVLLWCWFVKFVVWGVPAAGYEVLGKWRVLEIGDGDGMKNGEEGWVVLRAVLWSGKQKTTFLGGFLFVIYAMLRTIEDELLTTVFTK